MLLETNCNPHELYNRDRTVYEPCRGLQIIPFYEKNGDQNFSDTYLAQVYRRIVREDTVKKVFYDGSARNTTDFIRFVTNPENEIYFVKFKGREAGFFWLNKFRQKAYFINYCFYREFRGRKEALDVSQRVIDFVFNLADGAGGHRIDVLLGLTPADNKLAVKFLVKNGMTILGKVPGFIYDVRKEKAVDGVFSYRQRDGKTAAFSLSSIFFLH